VASLRFGCFFFLLDAIGLSGSLKRHGHAKGDSFLPFADLPFPVKPTVIGVEWSGLQIAPRALFQRKQGVPEAKRGVPDYVNSSESEAAQTNDGGRQSLPQLT
jgi:hypothetical protein